MSEASTYPLRLPKSLREEVTRVAKRAKAADIKAFRDILFRTGGEAPRIDDELVHR